MEGFFCPTPNFFYQSCRQSPREGDHPPQHPYKIGKEVANFQGPTAHCHKIHPRTGQNSGHIVPTHHPVAHPQGVEEQRGSDQQPKNQIQYRPQKGQMQPCPEDAKEVIHHTHQRTHCQGPQQRDGLPGN